MRRDVFAGNITWILITAVYKQGYLLESEEFRSSVDFLPAARRHGKRCKTPARK